MKLHKFYYNILLFTTLLVCWYVFSGYNEPFFLISGLISCILTWFICARLNILTFPHSRINIFKTITYSLWLLKEIFISSFQVAKIIYQPNSKLKPKTDWIKSDLASDVSNTIYANSITLTPGTVCIEVADGQLQIHALVSDSIDGITQGSMGNKINKIFRR